jgi:hypothetical protein
MSKLTLHKASLIVVSLATLSSFGFSSIASAIATPTKAGTAAAAAAANTAKLNKIKATAKSDINERLATLSKLTVKITDSKKLNLTDIATLNTEVSTTNAQLVKLNTKIQADTTVTTAQADTNSIFTTYRVYLLVVPKIDIISYADQQETVEGDLMEARANLIPIVAAAGSNATYESQLNDINTKEVATAGISSTIEDSVINLTPTDYDTNHAVMAGDLAKLKANQTAINAALADLNSLNKELSL